MSHNDSTPDRSSRGPDGSSSRGGDVPEYGQRIEGAPSGPSYDPSGRGQAGEQHAAPQYGQDQYGQYGQGNYPQGQYGQDQYGQGNYPQGQYGGPGRPGQYGQAPYPHGHYDMGPYGGAARPAGSGLGVAALVLGILALLTSWLFGLGLLPGVVGLVLGIVAVRRLGRVPGGSKAVPVIGIVLSVLGVLASIAFFFVLLSFMSGILEGPCNQHLSDPVAFELCLNEEMGLAALQR